MKTKNFVRISAEEAFEILSENQDFREYIDAHNMVFVDGYFVKANEKFVEERHDGLHLTKYAKSHLADCAINIRKNSFVKYIAKLTLKHLKACMKICMHALKISLSVLVVIAVLLGLISFAYNHIGIFVVIAAIIFLLFTLLNDDRLEDNYEDRGRFKRYDQYKNALENNYRSYNDEEDYDYKVYEDKFPCNTHRSILDSIAGAARNTFSSGELDNRLLILNPKYQSTLHRHFNDEQRKGTRSQLYDITPDDIYDSALSFLEDNNLNKRFSRLLGDPNESLSSCLWFIMHEKGWQTSETFWDQTLLHRNYFSKIKNNKFNNVRRETLMAICVGLGLTLRMVEKVFRKAKLMLQEYEEPDQTYMTILEYFPGLSINNFNSILENKGFKPLGTPIKED